MAPLYLYGYLFPWKLKPRFHVVASRGISVTYFNFPGNFQLISDQADARFCEILQYFLLSDVLLIFPRRNCCNETKSVTNAC